MITHEKCQKWVLLTAPYRGEKPSSIEEVCFAAEEDLRSAGWRPAAEVGTQISLISRTMLDQLLLVLEQDGSGLSWEEALDTVRKLVLSKVHADR